MNTVLTRVAAGASAAVFMVSGIAAAQNVKEVKIQAERVINEKVIAHITGGGKIIELTLSYRVSFADLDITSITGAAELEKRVKDAARAACEEIGSKYPGATPSDAVCAQKAAAKAMGEVRKMVATAQ
ncbi:MAG TPA: UrcA family protein [Steroidobacteraceae bacterium]|jgi:UrcA family protein|nr:UrcA family protein [Steroidobacteraceae bacterium]